MSGSLFFVQHDSGPLEQVGRAFVEGDPATLALEEVDRLARDFPGLWPYGADSHHYSLVVAPADAFVTYNFTDVPEMRHTMSYRFGQPHPIPAAMDLLVAAGYTVHRDGERIRG